MKDLIISWNDDNGFYCEEFESEYFLKVVRSFWMIQCQVIFEGDLIYCNSLTIQNGGIMYFVENSEGCVVLDYVSLEEAIKYCLENWYVNI